MSQRVFITGASGYLGSAIATRLVRAGHQVHGLTRSPENAAALARQGITPLVGVMGRPETYLGVLKNCDAAVHVGLDPKATAPQDQSMLEAFRHAAEDGRLRRLLYTSGIWVQGATHGKVVDEAEALEPATISRWRAAHEEVALDLVDDEVDVVVFRPAIVYGETRGIIGDLFAQARDKRTLAIPGTGAQHWAMVHREDVAEAYRLGLQYANGGERYLLADDSRLTAGEIGGAIARVTGATAMSWDAADVVKKLGPYGEALLLDQQVSSLKARRELGWTPRHASFVAEIEDLYRAWTGERTAVG